VALLQDCKSKEIEWLGLTGTMLDQIHYSTILALALLQKRLDLMAFGAIEQEQTRTLIPAELSTPRKFREEYNFSPSEKELTGHECSSPMD
jgi:hypothetical protein